MRRRTFGHALRTSVLALTLAVGLVASAATAAHADEELSPSISLLESSVAPGDTLFVEVSDWAPDVTVTVQFARMPTCPGDCALLESDVIEQRVLPTGSGTVATQFVVPADLAEGLYYVSAFGPPFGGSVEKTVTVAAPTSPPALSLDVTTASPGDSIVVTGSHYPFDEMWIVLTTVLNDPWFELGAVSVSEGSFRYRASIPADTPPGDYEVWAVSGAAVPAIAELTIAPAHDPEPVPSPQATASIGWSSVVQGDTVSITGSGFERGETVRIEFGAEPVTLATVAVAADGTVSTDVTIPVGATQGTQDIALIGEASGRIAIVAVTVTAKTMPADTAVNPASKTEELAATGVDDAALALPIGVAVAAIAGGMLLLRRRMTSAS